MGKKPKWSTYMKNTTNFGGSSWDPPIFFGERLKAPKFKELKQLEKSHTFQWWPPSLKSTPAWLLQNWGLRPLGSVAFVTSFCMSTDCCSACRSECTAPLLHTDHEFKGKIDWIYSRYMNIWQIMSKK